MLKHVHFCSIHENHKLEIAYMFLNRRMKKENVICLHNVVILILKLTSWNLEVNVQKKKNVLSEVSQTHKKKKRWYVLAY